MNTYNNWAKFYDAIYGDRANDISKIQNLIKENHPNAKTVLEIACGTGKIIKGLSDTYEVSGLDLSEGQVEEAKKILPNRPIYHQSMVDFKVDQNFDVILCLFNSINHITKYEDWISTFRSVKDHLNPNGIFIFDINTIKKLDRLSSFGAMLQEFPVSNFRSVQVIKTGEGTYKWEIKVFEHVKDNNYVLHTDTIPELAVEYEQVYNTLKDIFNEVKAKDRSNAVVNEESQVLYFICKL